MLFETSTILAVVVTAAIFGIVLGLKALIRKKKISVPPTVAEWINKFSWSTLENAYKTAEAEAVKPDEKRDLFIDYIQKIALKSFGVVIPDSTANFICEYVVAVMKIKSS